MTTIRPLGAILLALALGSCGRNRAPEPEAPPARPATLPPAAADGSPGAPREGAGAGRRAFKAVIERGHLTDEDLAALRAAAPEARLAVVEGEETLVHMLREIADADALLTSILTPELLRAAPRLRWIQLYAAGIDEHDLPGLLTSGITVTSCKIIQGPEIADHAFALLLVLTRRLHEIVPRRERGSWRAGHYRRRENWPLELDGKTALVVGLGGIGMQIAQRAHAFGMEVIAVDPKDIPPTYLVKEIVKPDRLHELLPRADVLFVAAPLTPESKRMFGARELALLKRGAYFIAVSRGGLYDTGALVQALEEGRLAGAGLDVTDPEPLPPDHALWKLPNVIITPHMAGQSDKVWERRFALLRENLRRFAGGLPLINIVDLDKGY